MNKAILRLLGAGTLALVLSGCGGGSSDDVPADQPDDKPKPEAELAEGLYRGTTSDNRTLFAMLLDDGTYWVLYSLPGSSDIGGGLQGSGELGEGTYTSIEGKDFSLSNETISDAGITASYLAKQYLDGTLTFGTAESVTFEADYDDYYETTPSLATVAGSRLGVAYSVYGGLATTIDIAADGGVTGTRGSCNISGTIAPRTHGNLYDLTLSFGGGEACILDGQTIGGVAMIDGDSGLMTAAVLDEEGTAGLLFVEAPAPL